MFADVSDINVGNMYFFNFINKVFLKLFLSTLPFGSHRKAQLFPSRSTLLVSPEPARSANGSPFGGAGAKRLRGLSP